MHSRISIWQQVGKATAILVLLLAAALFLGYIALDMLINRPDAPNPVQKIPLGAEQQYNLPSYKGYHPRVLSRADDPYPYPIAVGEVGPQQSLYSIPAQYPFYCRTEESDLGQPIVDNQEGLGVPVYQEQDGKQLLAGYSKDCLLPTQVRYFYKPKDEDNFLELIPDHEEIEQLQLGDQQVDFIVRVETGTINRFIYMLAALAPRSAVTAGDQNQVDPSLWNHKLIYQFRGGVGIGKVQGRVSQIDLLNRRLEQLRLGYGIAYSSANQTSNHYNIWLAEETAARVKRQFSARYGEPRYTIGIGGSGGAIQQYLIAQNHPGLIDAAIALYAYPDMITQTTYVFDCELLEYYFDVQDGSNPRWRDWSQRSLIEGLNAANGDFTVRSLLHNLALIFHQQKPHFNSESNECVRAWRGLTPLVNNPRYIYHAGRYSQQVLQQSQWSYWDDMKYILGTNAQGFARQTWDNVGVQYGLSALVENKITVEEFLNLNARVGSWKPPEQMQPEQYWKFTGINGIKGLLNFSPWGQHNMNLSPDSGHTPAKRHSADLNAIAAAYRSGQVFMGYADIPIIDLRHYLDNELDMHHSFASFSARQRMIEGQGSAANQLIWMTAEPHNPVPEAFQLLDLWLNNIENAPHLDAADTRPESAHDSCFDASGTLISSGPQVWDGPWNKKPEGDCSTIYPTFRESRMVAGAPITGDHFKCQLQSIESAVDKGVYGSVDITPYQNRLQAIFPEGVCDYSLPGLGKPANIMHSSATAEVLKLPSQPPLVQSAHSPLKMKPSG